MKLIRYLGIFFKQDKLRWKETLEILIQRARDNLEQYLKRQPRDAEATLALARAHRASDPQTALSWARLAERMLPQSPHAKVYRIQASLRAGPLSDEQIAGLVAEAEALVGAPRKCSTTP